jgi:outer membrane biosynthesis protein TonB
MSGSAITARMRALACVALLLPVTAGASWAQSVCPPMTAPILQTHTRPPTGDELLHPREHVWVVLKVVIRPDGTSDVGVSRSSGVTALNERAVAWVRDHWRWPRGCVPGTTRRLAIGFRGW